MDQVIYRIVEHDGGWAYKVGDVFSETFGSRHEATDAARIAASEQQQPGETTDIAYQDESGFVHEEAASGRDRPETGVKV